MHRARLLACLILAGATVIGCWGLGAAESQNAPSIYVLTGGNAEADAAAVTALRDAGFTVTRGVPTPLWDGSQTSLSQFSAVVALNGYNWITAPMASSGQQSLVRYVSRGGGLVTAEWLLWNVYLSGYYKGLQPAMPASTGSYAGVAGPTTYVRRTPDPVLDAGLPEQFEFSRGNIFGSESVLLARPGATLFYDSSGTHGAGIVGWDYRQGRVINFSTFIGPVELANASYKRLFTNAVHWVARR